MVAMLVLQALISFLREKQSLSYKQKLIKPGQSVVTLVCQGGSHRTVTLADERLPTSGLSNFSLLTLGVSGTLKCFELVSHHYKGFSCNMFLFAFIRAQLCVLKNVLTFIWLLTYLMYLVLAANAVR